MKLSTKIIFLITHLALLIGGFAAAYFVLPKATLNNAIKLDTLSNLPLYSGQFRKDLKDSDQFHWGEGEVNIGTKMITFKGELADGPDYKLYLSKQYVETEDEFLRLEPTMTYIGDVEIFGDFALVLPEDVDPNEYNSVIIWCEFFEEFITAAKYK